MKKQIYILTLILITNLQVFSQINFLDTLISRFHYEKAIVKYKKQLDTAKAKETVNYNNMVLAYCYSMINQKDTALKYLRKLKNVSDYQFSFLSEPMLFNLHEAGLIEEFKDIPDSFICSNCKDLNREYALLMAELSYNDQKYRSPYIINYFKTQNKESLWKTLLIKNDSVNLATLEKLINKYGFPYGEKVNGSGPMTFFLIIQHADLKTQKKYLPFFLELSKKNVIPAFFVAMLQDRMLKNEGKKQIYGTQVKENEKTGKNELYPVIDEENVDKRRDSVGLYPLKEYLAEFGIDYQNKKLKDEQVNNQNNKQKIVYAKNNLLPNYGFEQYKEKALDIKDSWNIIGWRGFANVPTYGTGYYNAIYSKDTLNHSKLEPLEGEACLRYEIFNHYSDNSSYMTYNIFQCKLSSTLLAGKKYRLELFYITDSMVSRVEELTHGAVSYGFSKTDRIRQLDSLKKKSQYPWADIVTHFYAFMNRVKFKDMTFDGKKWRKLSFEYTGKGGENYFLIGNLPDKENLKSAGFSRFTYTFFVYLDNIKLGPISNNDSLNIKYLIKGKTLELDNLFFETAKYKLLPESYEQLDKLYNVLHENPKLRVEISGHTDNIGNNQENLLLSENRAKAVAEYLCSKGIDKNRVMVKGYGSRKPVTGNSTEEGRQKNRRVEITVLEN